MRNYKTMVHMSKMGTETPQNVRASLMFFGGRAVKELYLSSLCDPLESPYQWNILRFAVDSLFPKTSGR